MFKMLFKLASLKAVLAAALLSVLFFNARAQSLNLIPKPVRLEPGEGNFVLNARTSIVLPAATDTGFASLFAARLKLATGFNLPLAVARSLGREPVAHLKHLKPGARNVIRLVQDENCLKSKGDEAYELEINSAGVTIRAARSAGWFYGMQTFMQLLSVGLVQNQKGDGYVIPAVFIEDYPRFKWRGLMVDVSRHFFNKDVIKRYIDQMAKYKLNTLHLHLTDNQGWRVAISSLPKLTDVGAWRVPRTGYWRGQKAPEPNEKATSGGFYTQEDIRELVAYGQQRFVEIVPEIDVPGHSLAMIAAYPELSCTKKPQQVLAGDPWNASRTNVLCAASDSVFIALDKVIGEIAQLFPSKYIHIGGDEVSRAYWDKCPVCQQKIKDEHLGSAEELQSYFLKRVAQIVLSKGKKPMGWYENLPGGLPDEMAVMSWKDSKGGLLSANKGQQVVMTPAFFTYLDFYQGDPYLENAIFTVNRLSTTFQFDPLPEGINAKNVLGGQGSLWTEQVPNERKLQSMTWPRAFALSEVLWSAGNKSDWNNFIRRVESHLPLLDREQVACSRYFYDAIVTATPGLNKEMLVKLSTEVEGLDIHYSFDDTDPDQYYPVYKGTPLSIPKGAQSIRVVTYRKGQQLGRLLKLPVTELQRRMPAK
ncbi:hexosaminidase [Pedobacter africanus]|uniref:beta-N-acetylhexosaminidase n=2 Tax=Pedobacter africanus TaxID=151894 RepID=A0A1W1Z6L4_9SPHI|nr:hexosaminidase [Pedobacter africanus]